MNQEEIMLQLQGAVVLHNQGELDQAAAIYRKVLAIEETNFYALRFLGCLQSSKGFYQSSISLLRQAILVLDSDSDCWYNLGNAYKANSQFKEAIDSYRSAEERGSANPQVFNNWGRCLQKLSMQQESIPVLEKAVGIDSDCFGAWFALGNSWRDVGEVSRAVFCYKKSIAASPSFVDAYLNLGNLLKEEVEVKEAIASYRKAIELQPDFADAYLNLGNVLKEEGEVEEAIASYRQAIEAKPDCADAYFSLGNVLKEKGRVEEAIASYRKAIEVKPDFVGALAELAGELTKRDEYDEAISLYKLALVEDPEHVNSSSGLGWCFLRSGRLEEVIAHYTHVLQISPGITDAFFFLFEALKGELKIKLNRKFSYSDNFLDKCLKLMCVSKIVAFGDSHVQLFEGRDEIEVNHVGASTAYNLVKEDSSTGGRRQVLNRVARMNPKTEAVLLCFGEVDIRANVIKYCYQKGLSIVDSVEDVIFRYVSFANVIASRGFKILIYGGYGAGSDRISVGSERERNYAAKCLNSLLFQKCEENGFVYFSLHDAFFNDKYLETDSSFLADGFHLYSNELTSRGEVQVLLFESAYKAVKALLSEPRKKSASDLVLGNVCTSSKLMIGSLESGCLSWEEDVDLLESVVFDLGTFIRFELMTFELDADLGVDQLTVSIDGHLVEVKLVKETSSRCLLLPASRSLPFIGRYLMLKAPSDLLLSIKGFYFQELSLV